MSLLLSLPLLMLSASMIFAETPLLTSDTMLLTGGKRNRVEKKNVFYTFSLFVDRQSEREHPDMGRQNEL